MAKAGYCAECDANVWLCEDGSCSNGHPASSVTGVYESEPVVQTQVHQPAAATAKSRRLVVVGVLVAVVVVLALCGGIALLAKPLANSGVAAAGQWQARLAKDYPGWKPVGFNVRSFSGSTGSQTESDFTLIPPGRDFSVGIAYLSKNGGPSTSQDEVFRPEGRFHDRSKSLLDFIEHNYVANDKTVTSVTADSDGSVTVNWLRVQGFGPFSWHVGSFDHLTYDDASGSWRVSSVPGS